MKKLFSLTALIMLFAAASAQTYKTKTWAQICSGAMGTEWYGSAEAISVADTLLGVQKTNGGWMKNDQYHKLTSAELAARKALTGTNGRSQSSTQCLNGVNVTATIIFRTENQLQSRAQLENLDQAQANGQPNTSAY